MGRLTHDQYRLAENELRVALEDQGQQVLLRYLQGDQVTQDAQNFETGALYFEGARLLTPESLVLESKELFCRGRALLFARRFNEAMPLLERAARLDARGAYSFNALGIAYLEQADYARATDAFRDAIRLAPYWVYPRHNLALTQTEQGQYAAALATYQDARALAPNYSYVAYNMGHVYQRIRLNREAETMYREAARIATKARDDGTRTSPAGRWSERAEVWNALATLDEDRSRYDRAQQLLRQALADDAQSFTARHNLARLLARRAPSAEAEQLWRQNLADDPTYLPSRFALAAYLERNGRLEESAAEYQTVLGINASDGSSGLAGTRELLSDVYVKLGRLPDAISALTPALKENSGNPRLLEKIGDLYVQAGNSQKEEAFRAALAAYKIRADQNRVKRKLRAAPAKTAK
jgi:tetratricopeptide (TPR) repeat protein